nr:MRN complex-interacting protein isoform X3 [Gorilla gorilla gorilla]
MQSARAWLAGDCTSRDGVASAFSGATLLQLPPLPGAPGKKECQVDMQSLWREAVLFAEFPRHGAPASELPVPSGSEMDGAESGKEKSQPSESRWLKYLEKDSQELELEGRGVCFSKQPSSKMEEPGPRFSQDLPRKRKWSGSTVQPPCSRGVQDSGGSEVAWGPQKGQAGLTWKVEQGSSPCLQENSADCSAGELRGPGKELWSPIQQVTATSSKWARFVLPPRKSSHVDSEQPRSLQRDPRPAGPAQAKQGTPRAQASREGLSRPTAVVQLPRATHPVTSGPERPCGKTSWDARTPWAEGGPLVLEAQNPRPIRLCDLFITGEDFDDDV